MEYKTAELRFGKHLAIVVLGNGTGFAALGDTEDAAVIRALEQAAREDAEARYELGVRLGVRGEGAGGRPALTGREGT